REFRCGTLLARNPCTPFADVIAATTHLAILLRSRNDAQSSHAADLWHWCRGVWCQDAAAWPTLAVLQSDPWGTGCRSLDGDLGCVGAGCDLGADRWLYVGSHPQPLGPPASLPLWRCDSA